MLAHGLKYIYPFIYSLAHNLFELKHFISGANLKACQKIMLFKHNRNLMYPEILMEFH
jgi:hypothetical protein